MTAEFMMTTFVLLAAGVVAVPIATRLGLGSVLGYLIAGILLAPVLAQLGVDVIELQHFAEFGVVMMLFLVGLELEPRLLWQMRARLLGLGGLQVGITTALVAAISMAFGLEWTIAVAVGLVFALSSTAIVLQTFSEKGLMKSDGGQAGFSVLLFQDIAVIPMLALLPLLAMPDLMESYGAGVPEPVEVRAEAVAPGTGGAGGGAPGDESAATTNHDDAGEGSGHLSGEPAWIETIPGWQRALVTLGAIAVVVVGGTYLTDPIFGMISQARLRELFTAAGLAMVFGIALLMQLVGLSAALGTFLAGVVLANSQYRHELESDIDPFRGLLLGVFFITVGAGINFALLWANAGSIIGMTIGLMALKAAVLFALAYAFRVRGGDKWLVTVSLAQAGEFGFVLLSFTVANDVIPPALADQLLLVVALSMLLTPGLFILYDRVIAPRYSASQEGEADEIDDDAPIIVAGHGRFGGIVNRMLQGAGFRTVVIDNSSQQLEMLRTFGFKVFYGDASRPDLLHAAGIAEAKMLVVAIDNREQANQIVHHVRGNHPDVHILARAVDRNHVYELWAAGCRDIIRETFDSALRAGRSAFEAMGMHPFEAENLAQGFVRRDREAMIALADLYDPDIPLQENAGYVARARELRAEQEAEMKTHGRDRDPRLDRAWLPPGMADIEAEELLRRGS